MPELYGRTANLTIAPIDGTQGIYIEEMRISFSVSKTGTREPNKANIKVYNLSENSRNRIQAKNQAVILDAGYEELHNVIASGVIQRVEHSRSGADIETMIEIRDGGLGLDHGQFRKNYTAGTSKMAIIKDIIATLTDVSKGPLLAVGLAGTIPYRMSFSGKSADALTKLSRAWKFEWSVQDGSIQILDRTSGRNPQTLAVEISAETGLIGSPTRTDKGAKFKSLLQGQINPGTLINLKSEFYSSVLKALSVTHSGDTHSMDSWSTEVEAKDLLAPAVRGGR